jgi:hypothetical protein
MKRRFRFVIPIALALSLVGTSLALAGSQKGGPKLKLGKHGGGAGSVHADLSGRQEVPAIRTAGKGHLRLTMTNSTTFSYELTFSGLTSNVGAAHIHFGAPATNGGVLVDLCGGTKPACPAATAGTVTGTFTAADIKAIPAQNFVAQDWNGFLEELRAGMLYANVHTANFAGGEIRGQLAHARGHDNGRHKGWFKDRDDD